jgi:hypothetical protein
MDEQIKKKPSAKEADMDEKEKAKQEQEEAKKFGQWRSNWKSWGSTAWFITIVT